MEPSASPAFPGAEQASLSACLTQLRNQLLERGEGKDFFETQVDDRFYCLTFTNAIILSCLATDKATADLRERLCQRLEQEIAERGTANYRMRTIPSAGLTPYPDDLDDTFCTLSAIHLHDKSRLGGEQLARATLALTTTEVEPGGPYRSWIVPPQADMIWRDVDPVVNANVAYFLKLQGILLPKLEAYLAQQITLPASPYYPSPLHVLYFLTRALEGTTHVKQLEDTLLACKATNVLEQAMLISSLLRCRAVRSARTLIPTFLRDLQAGHGFDALPVCVDTITAGTKHFATCVELTASMCVEALNLLMTTVETPKVTDERLDPSLTTIAAAKVLLNTTTDPVLQTLTDGFLAKLTNIPQVRELTALPLDFAKKWGPQTRGVPETALQNLSVAHFLGWVAYTLYDDMIDNDGTPALLSVANIAARQMYRLYGQLDLDHDFQGFFYQKLDAMDEANALELLHARFPLERLPDYSHPKSLYARSAGIMLSPVAVLRLAGYGQNTNEVKTIIDFFENYLAAKQLNDDAHDWQEDLSRGHATAVVTRVLARYGKAYDPNDIKTLQALFWHDVIVEVCRDIRDHIARARASLQKLGTVEDPSFFTKLIDPLEASADMALLEREQSLAFLNTFSQPN